MRGVSGRSIRVAASQRFLTQATNFFMATSHHIAHSMLCDPRYRHLGLSCKAASDTAAEGGLIDLALPHDFPKEA